MNHFYISLYSSANNRFSHPPDIGGSSLMFLRGRPCLSTCLHADVLVRFSMTHTSIHDVSKRHCTTGVICCISGEYSCVLRHRGAILPRSDASRFPIGPCPSSTFHGGNFAVYVCNHNAQALTSSAWSCTACHSVQTSLCSRAIFLSRLDTSKLLKDTGGNSSR